VQSGAASVGGLITYDFVQGLKVFVQSCVVGVVGVLWLVVVASIFSKNASSASSRGEAKGGGAKAGAGHAGGGGGKGQGRGARRQSRGGAQRQARQAAGGKGGRQRAGGVGRGRARQSGGIYSSCHFLPPPHHTILPTSKFFKLALSANLFSNT